MALTPKLFRRQVVDAARDGEPASPRCPHAPPLGFCGGCTFQDRSYAGQVAAKRAALRQLWAGDLPPDRLDAIELVASPEPFAYRTRMDYVASKGRFGLRRGGKFNYIVDLGECHLIAPAAFAVARGLYERAIALGLPDYNLRSHEGFVRYVVVRYSPQGKLLLAFVTAAHAYVAEMEQIAEHALGQPGVAGFHWLLNESLTDVSFGAPLRHWGAETLPMRVGARSLAIGPNTFFQNNVHLLLPLLDDILSAVSSRQSAVGSQQSAASSQCDEPQSGLVAADCRPATVADLYGGVGTIALHLADHVRHITCVESFAESARLGEHNVAANAVANVAMVNAEVLAFLREQPAGGFDVVVADPPRTGLGPEVCRELLRLRPTRLVYVSCNVLSQIADARELAPGYRLSTLCGYDMFPQTPHMEALAVFDHRPSRNEDRG